jgi:hypothetical protein
VNADRPEPGLRLLDQALRLLDVAQATRPAGVPQDAKGPLAQGAGTECRSCPVCRGIAYLREVDPQAVERLTGAVTEVAGAVRDLLGPTPTQAQHDGHDTTAGAGTTAGADGIGGAGGCPGVPRVRVQRIDVTD